MRLKTIVGNLSPFVQKIQILILSQDDLAACLPEKGLQVLKARIDIQAVIAVFSPKVKHKLCNSRQLVLGKRFPSHIPKNVMSLCTIEAISLHRNKLVAVCQYRVNSVTTGIPRFLPSLYSTPFSKSMLAQECGQQNLFLRASELGFHSFAYGFYQKSIEYFKIK